MGRPRTPTKVLKALGSFKKDPKREREREGEPTVTGKIGRPPNSFMIQSPDQGYQQAERLRAIWRQVQRDAPWLDRANRMVVEALCYATDAVRQESKPGRKGLSQALAAQARLLNDLGIPQASRSKLKLGDLEDEGSSGSGSVWMSLEVDL